MFLAFCPSPMSSPVHLYITPFLYEHPLRMSMIYYSARVLLWPPYGIGQAIIFWPCGFFFFFYLSNYLFSSPNLSGRRLDVCRTWCGLSANLRCRSEMCCTRLAANTGRKRSSKNRHLGTIPQLCRAISSQLRHISTIGKKLFSSNISSTCSHNMVNFGPLAAEIDPVVWGTPANFNGFCGLAALLHDTPLLGVSQSLRRWTEGATYIRQGGYHVGRWTTL